VLWILLVQWMTTYGASNCPAHSYSCQHSACHSSHHNEERAMLLRRIVSDRAAHSDIAQTMDTLRQKEIATPPPAARQGDLCIDVRITMRLRCVLLQTQPDQGEANVHKRSWNGDGKETNGHSGACTARPANTMLAQRTPHVCARRHLATGCKNYRTEQNTERQNY
jgi:hypothetical protein